MLTSQGATLRREGLRELPLGRDAVDCDLEAGPLVTDVEVVVTADRR
jgi:hypothetical protein